MATEPYAMAGGQQVEVLLAGSDPEYLSDVAGRVTQDGIEVHTVATTDPEAAIDRINRGDVDCLIATYNPSANEGLPILDYLQESSVEVPVILLPSGPTTVVVSENLVVDVASVFTRDEAISGGRLGPDVVVDAVEERQASEAAQRRRGIEQALREVARGLSEADAREEVDRSLVEGMAETEELDAAWMTEVDGDEVTVREGAGDAAPPEEGPPAEAVERALAVEQPQVASGRDGTAYAAVPVVPEHDEGSVLTMASRSRYAFSDEETRVLADVGDTARRAIDDVARRQVVPGEFEGRAAFETMLERLSVPVVAYGDAGWVAGVNSSFAELVGEAAADLGGQPVWDVLPAPRLETFEDYWASFDAGETRTQLVDFAAEADPRQLVTTRVAVDDEPYNVALAVEPVEESADPWFAEVLAYEFRHWLAIAEEALADEGEESEVLDAVVDRMQDAMASEVETAQARVDAGLEPEDLQLDEGDLAEAAAARDAARAGDVDMRPQPVSGLARDAWMTVVGEFGDYEIRGDRKVLADRTLLHRLFAHLFRTLLSYGNASAVDVGLDADGFFVEDDGAGVAHADRDYAEATTMTDAQSGASLQVARRLADRHGWTLRMTANDAGGTRFEVSGVQLAEDD